MSEKKANPLSIISVTVSCLLLMFATGCESTNSAQLEHSKTSTQTGDQKIFETSSLDSVPKAQGRYEVTFPDHFKEKKKEGLVAMSGVINPDGTVTILNVEKTIDQEYTEIFISFFESLKYSKPTVNGRPVTAKIYFRIPVAWE